MHAAISERRGIATTRCDAAAEGADFIPNWLPACKEGAADGRCKVRPRNPTALGAILPVHVTIMRHTHSQRIRSVINDIASNVAGSMSSEPCRFAAATTVQRDGRCDALMGF
eukprot:1653572-Pleurochrysis_carterae.AAC.2